MCQPGTKFQASIFGIVGKLRSCRIPEKKPPSVHFGEKKLYGLEEGAVHGYLIRPAQPSFRPSFPLNFKNRSLEFFKFLHRGEHQL